MEEMVETNRGAATEPVSFGVEAYISPDYARAEREKLWTKIWQQVGRIEEIPEVGDFLTYAILDDSIIVVRTGKDQISAFHNVCMHRGRRLVDTAVGDRNTLGHAKQFTCGYHGWRYNIDGENVHVQDKSDWGGALSASMLCLRKVKVDTWGGWIWINMDPDCEPLRDYLEPAAGMLDPFNLEGMRYRWRRWIVFDCNWKVAMEAFLESYHVEGTHPQFLKFADWYTWSRARGRHSHSGYMQRDNEGSAESLMRVGKGDARVVTAGLQMENWTTTNAATTKTMVDAAMRLVDELPEGTPSDQVMQHWFESARRDDAARGVIWPTIDPAHLSKCGSSWNIFPNFKIIPLPTTALCYSVRPYGYDPDKCIYEAFVVERFPEGEEPESEWIYTPADDAGWLSVLPQDFSNMAAVQQGMKSIGFPGTLPNPVQENAVTNLHRQLAAYMGTGAPVPLGDPLT